MPPPTHVTEGNKAWPASAMPSSQGSAEMGAIKHRGKVGGGALLLYLSIFPRSFWIRRWDGNQWQLPGWERRQHGGVREIFWTEDVTALALKRFVFYWIKKKWKTKTDEKYSVSIQVLQSRKSRCATQHNVLYALFKLYVSKVTVPYVSFIHMINMWDL